MYRSWAGWSSVSRQKDLQLDDVRVRASLSGLRLGLMVAMALVSGIAPNRGECQVGARHGCRGGHRHPCAVVAVRLARRHRNGREHDHGRRCGPPTAVLARRYRRAGEGNHRRSINKIQETIVAGATAPEEKAAIDKVVAERQTGAGSRWPRPGSSRARAMRWKRRRFADETGPHAHGGALLSRRKTN